MAFVSIWYLYIPNTHRNLKMKFYCFAHWRKSTYGYWDSRELPLMHKVECKSLLYRKCFGAIGERLWLVWIFIYSIYIWIIPRQNDQLETPTLFYSSMSKRSSMFHSRMTGKITLINFDIFFLISLAVMVVMVDLALSVVIDSFEFTLWILWLKKIFETNPLCPTLYLG